MELSDLRDETVYELYVTGSDAYGNEAKSDTNTYTTPLDTRPPEITKVAFESSNVGLDKQDTAQIAVSWETNEDSTSMVEYGEGVSGDQYTNKSVEDKTMSKSHLVIVGDLIPSKPYHFRVTSVDKGNNTGTSPDNTVISGETPKSVLAIILQSLKNAFGWIGGGV